jgi:hypothetical protein
MSAEAGANETWRKRPTQVSRDFLEHALICDGFAVPLSSMASAQRCSRSSTVIYLALAAPILQSGFTHQKSGAQLREPVAKAAFRPENALERIASASVEGDCHEQIHPSFRNGCRGAAGGPTAASVINTDAYFFNEQTPYGKSRKSKMRARSR